MKKGYQPPVAELLLLTAADILSNSMEENEKDPSGPDLDTW